MTLIRIAVALALLPGAALAQEDQAWRELATLGFSGVDADRSGEATLQETMAYVEDVFVSMDSDEDESLSEAKFTSWGFGMVNLAQERGRQESYAAVVRTMFDLWDRDDSGAMSLPEHTQGAADGFFYADADGDGLLSESEYAKRFIYNVVSRNALRTN